MARYCAGVSEENIERMRQSQAAFEHGDRDAWGAFVHPDVEVVFTFRDGLFARAEWFENRQEALEAAGLSE